MKMLFIYLIIIIVSQSLCAQQEPVVKIYQSDGSTKQYNIKDIADLSFIHSNLSYSMIVFRKENSKISYDIRLINSINFVDNQKLQIKYGFEPITYNITEIDSIIFVFNTCTEIQIGNQIWMCKNLDVDHYRNGDSIPEVRDSAEWVNLTTGAWSYYKNDISMGKIYGKLYNGYVLNDPRGLAPEGWHIPSDSEWTILINYLGGEDICGGKMKEIGFNNWNLFNKGATNESGFTALPGGFRNYGGVFINIKKEGYWWSSTQGHDSTELWIKILYTNNTGIFKNSSRRAGGLSVRCIKDN